jgi:hypothetical protein
MADRRGARGYPVDIPGTFSGTALIDSPSGVLSPGTLVSVKVGGQWRAAVVRSPERPCNAAAFAWNWLRLHGRPVAPSHPSNAGVDVGGVRTLAERTSERLRAGAWIFRLTLQRHGAATVRATDA